MDERLKELIELNEAVDTVCKACDKENEKRKQIIYENYEDMWNGMWDDIELNILPVVEKLDLSNICCDYNYTYIRTDGKHYWNDQHRIKFLKLGNNVNGKVVVYLDRDSGHTEINRKDFAKWFSGNHRASRDRVKGLLNDWERLYDVILNDLSEKLEKQIKDKLKAKEIETKKLMHECGESL